MKRRILFVCMGNICRSPLAEGIARAHAARFDEPFEFDSAGTADYHIGAAPDPRAASLARRRGAPIDALRARQVTVQDFHDFDLILAADRRNLRALQALAPSGACAEIALLLDWADAGAPDEVPDPYYGDDAGFERVFELIYTAMPALLRRAAGA